RRTRLGPLRARAATAGADAGLAPAPAFPAHLRLGGCMMHPAPLPRPGVRLGPYPQRQDTREPWSWFGAEVLRAALAAARAPGAVRRAAFLRAVHDKRAVLDGCDIEFIGAGARRLRPQLAVEGLRDALVAELFAHVDAAFHLHLGMRLHDNQLLAAW